MSSLKIICIHSLTAYGNVGLKPFLQVLGSHCLPLPSLLLNGPGDMPGVCRAQVDLACLLEGTLEAAAARGDRVVLFCGYLARADQVSTLLSAIERFRSHIFEIIVDPVSGDDGRAYVNPELLAAWPRLLGIADWALPNRTELELLANAGGEEAVAAWRTRFPKASFIITSWEDTGKTISTRLLEAGNATGHTHTQLRFPERYNGSGDLFAALWVRARHLYKMDSFAALIAASSGVQEAIASARAAGGKDLAAPAEFTTGLSNVN